ncbi:iron-siderophore ABC transporter substrate-binding protein [Neisseria weixii]|uniref:Iron-siderophore ABC transporter substrate-binding protein n=1 Tax=Neisseria weixii TaxID=1853276 RepID=A0A3N4NAP1_9NEIS|nr:iron-siderophore ABC transporter substrate-binding protein [Neisseria weixii]RPD89643.1 iron-siderophore ABC transporter substrate-binding protein [Neisseria weixii]
MIIIICKLFFVIFCSPKHIVTFKFYRIIKLSTALLLVAGIIFQTACRPQAQQAAKPFVVYERAGHQYPVTLNGSLGCVTLQKAPERVVVLGAGTVDLVVALGIQPVAMEANLWGGDENGYMPWFKEFMAEQKRPLPPTVVMYPELDAEKLVSFNPDLIIATQSGLSEENYRLLSGFAPVIAHPHKPWMTTVDEQIDIIAAAFGKQKQAAALKAQIGAEYADFRRRHPKLQGKTFAYIYSGARSPQLSVYAEGEPRVDALYGLGLKMSPDLVKMSVDEGSWSVALGLENADKLNQSDIVITWFFSEEDQKMVEARPLFREIKAVKRGTYLPLLDREVNTAMYQATPQSLRWGLRRLEADWTRIENALD